MDSDLTNLINIASGFADGSVDGDSMQARVCDIKFRLRLDRLGLNEMQLRALMHLFYLAEGVDLVDHESLRGQVADVVRQLK